MDEMLAYLEQLTLSANYDDFDERFTAEVMAKRFGVKRNTISNWCNRLVEQGLLIKLGGRPVRFLHSKAFSQTFFSPQQ
ncbi:hypothetical protein LJC55_02610, partial [Eubacteriales bacterium OttesenSCG-928-N14]|nr:hypothetical protein [Eubacteriales bacterium OttesenSCG-928-N14]